SESLLPLCLFAFRPPDDSCVALLPVSAGSACPTFANVTTLFVLNREDAVVSLSRLLGRIAGILQSARYIGVPKSLGGRLLGCALHGREKRRAGERRQPVAQRLSAIWRDRILRTPRALCAGNP